MTVFRISFEQRLPPPPLKRGKSVSFMEVINLQNATTMSNNSAGMGGHLAPPPPPIRSSSSPPSPSSRNTSLVLEVSVIVGTSI